MKERFKNAIKIAIRDFLRILLACTFAYLGLEVFNFNFEVIVVVGILLIYWQVHEY